MIEFLIGMGYTCLYFIICASIALFLRHFLKIPDELFRKILHLILLGSLLLWIYAFSNWWISALGCIVFAVIVYPILKLAEKIKTYSKVVTERKKGELKSSLLIVFSMFAIVITICWGLFQDRLLAIASIYAWGFGDAIAALVGKKVGKHKLHQKKTLEGSISMFITSLVTVFIICLIKGILPWYGSVITSVIVALVTSLVELYTQNGYDTITCPLSAMAVIIPLIYMFGGL